jgi:hypothetical protein
MKFDEPIGSPAPASAQTGARLPFTLEEGAYAAQSFAAALHICPNPTCGCAHIGFECQPLPAANDPSPGPPAGSAPLCFDLDVFERTFNLQPGASPAAKALGRAVVAELQTTHWETLSAFFLAAKRRQMETMDLNALDPHFPRAVSEGAWSPITRFFPGRSPSSLRSAQNGGWWMTSIACSPTAPARKRASGFIV